MKVGLTTLHRTQVVRFLLGTIDNPDFDWDQDFRATLDVIGNTAVVTVRSHAALFAPLEEGETTGANAIVEVTSEEDGSTDDKPTRRGRGRGVSNE